MQDQMPRPQATFEKVTTVTTRNQNGSIIIEIEPVVNESGNAGGGGIAFERTDDHILVGEVIDETPDGRKHELARAINRVGSRKIKSVRLPPAGLEHLGIDRETATDGVDVDLWVCSDPDIERSLVAVTPVIRQTMQFGVGDSQ